MAIIKCKMCGGDLEVKTGSTVAECEYCGSRQTVPTVDNEKKLTLFARANRLRFGCEFDKASVVYGQCNVSDWTDIKAISAGSSYTSGLKKDGTVITVGENSVALEIINTWINFVSIETKHNRTIGIKSDGTAVVAGTYKIVACNVEDWRNLQTPYNEL